MRHKLKIFLLMIGVVIFVNSCLAVATVGAVGAGVNAAISIIELPIKIISGVVNIVSGNKRDKEIKNIGESKYVKIIDKILSSNRKEEKIENFNIYMFENLEFTKKDGKIFQLVDKKSKVSFPFTLNVEKYNSKDEIEKKLNDLSKSEGVSNGVVVYDDSLTTRTYEVKVNNKKEKTIEKYKVVLIEKDNNLLTYQYLISTDSTFELEKQIFEDIINNTF